MRVRVLALAWIATVAAAWWLGRSGIQDPDPARPGADASSVEAVPPRCEPAQPMLAPRTGASRATGHDAIPAGPIVSHEEFVRAVDGEVGADARNRLLMDRMTALLARGEAGHLDALRLLSWALRSEEFEWFWMDDESDASTAGLRLAWLAWLEEHGDSVAGAMGTLYEKLYQDPDATQGLTNQVLMWLNDHVTAQIAAVSSPEARARLARNARRFVRLGDKERAFEFFEPEPTWDALGRLAAHVDAEEALRRLQVGAFDGSPELCALVARLSPEQCRTLDAEPLLSMTLTPMTHDADCFRDLAYRLPLTPAVVAGVDHTFVEHSSPGRFSSEAALKLVCFWLGVTKRRGWPEAGPLVVAGLAGDGKTAEFYALALPMLKPPPSVEEARMLLLQRKVSDEVRRGVLMRIAELSGAEASRDR